MAKRKMCRVLSLVMATIATASFGACSGANGGENSGGHTIDTSETTLNVRIRKAGYGTDYIYALAEQFEKTFAELTDEEKNAVSHRGRAMRAVADFLREEFSKMDDFEFV